MQHLVLLLDLAFKHREEGLRQSRCRGKLASVVMSHVLSREKREQVIALGRLGWSLRRIEQATGVRRETAGDYLRVAGIALRRPGGWGRQGPSKAAIDPITDSGRFKTGHQPDHRL